jgi:hypothetical protein
LKAVEIDVKRERERERSEADVFPQCAINGGQTDRQTDRQTDEEGERRKMREREPRKSKGNTKCVFEATHQIFIFLQCNTNRGARRHFSGSFAAI